MHTLDTHKRSEDKQAERDPNTNTNTNTNSADSISSSTATADNTNNINNTATASQSQEQDACAVAVTCPEGSTTITPPPDPCPHSPYTDFVAGTGCQDGAQQTICNPSTVLGQTATPTDGTCIASLPAGSTSAQLNAFLGECSSSTNVIQIIINPLDNSAMCIFRSTQACPTPTGSTQTQTVVSGRCTIQPGAT